jgi:hypothetical protein
MLPIAVMKGHDTNLGSDFIVYENMRIIFSWTGLLLSLIFILAGFILLSKERIYEYDISLIDYAYLALLSTIVLVPIIPSIYLPGRFNLTMYELSDRLLPVLPVIGHLIALSIFIEPLIYALLIHHGGRNLFYIYLSYPIFNVVSLWSFILILGWKYGVIMPVIPTWGLIIPLLVVAVDYILTIEEPPHEEASSSASN